MSEKQYFEDFSIEDFSTESNNYDSDNEYNYDSDNDSIEKAQLLEKAVQNAGFQKSRTQTEQLLEKAGSQKNGEKKDRPLAIKKRDPKVTVGSVITEKFLEKTVNKKEESKPKNSSSSSSSALEEKFEFNQETINFYTKDLDCRKILINHKSKSPCLENLNDTIIICLLIKIGNFKDYHCNTPKCKVGKIWNGKAIQLILIRKNSIQLDLSINNLDLICANCYMVTYGLDMFIKKKKESILTCKFCEFPLVTFKDNRKKKGICFSCEKQSEKMSFEIAENNFINSLKKTYSNNPVLNDDFKKNNYFNEFKKNTNTNKYNISNTFENNYQSSSKVSINTNNISKQNNIIDLNMNIPDLSNLINEE